MGQRHLDRGTLRRRLKQRKNQQRGMRAATLVAQEQAHKATFLLCAVLAQYGGSKTVTQGTLDQCMAAADKIGFSMQPGAVAGEYELRLMYQEAAQATEAAVEQALALPPVAPIVITS